MKHVSAVVDVFLKVDPCPSPLCCHVTSISYMKVQFSKHSSLWYHIRQILVSEMLDVSEVGGRGDSEGISAVKGWLYSVLQ